MADWIPALSTSTILAIAAFLVGPYYKTRIEKSVLLKFDSQLEELKSKLSKDVELFRADLRARDEQLAALRTGALAAMANRHTALDSRRLEAAERIWAAVISMRSLKASSQMISALNMERCIVAAAKQDDSGRKVREFGEILWKSSGIDVFRAIKEVPDKERPFVSPIAWALFSAYRSVLNYPHIQLAVMKTGAGPEILRDPKPLIDVVKSALPHYSAFLDQERTSGMYLLIDELEEKLFGELVASFDGSASDEKSVKQAAEILRAASKVSFESAETADGQSIGVYDEVLKKMRADKGADLWLDSTRSPPGG